MFQIHFSLHRFFEKSTWTLPDCTHLNLPINCWTAIFLNKPTTFFFHQFSNESDTLDFEDTLQHCASLLLFVHLDNKFRRVSKFFIQLHFISWFTMLPNLFCFFPFHSSHIYAAFFPLLSFYFSVTRIYWFFFIKYFSKQIKIR